MKKKYINKKNADNYFTKATGVKAYRISGTKHCLIVPQKSITMKVHGLNQQIPIAVAACHLLHDIPFSEIGKVVQNCGINECVESDHIVADCLQTLDHDPATQGWGQQS